MGNPTPETNTAMVPAKPPEDTPTSIAKYGDHRSLQLELRALRSALPGLSDPEKVKDSEVMALLIASHYSKLSPYSGEIYLIPGKGVMTASKVKAADAITAAARRGDHLLIDFDPVPPETPMGKELEIERGDVAYLCRIRSSKATDRWYANRLALVTERKALGYSRPEIEEALAVIYPTEPDYRAVGIVKAAEDFGDKYKKADVFSRKDRAKKRALIKCLNANGLAATDQRSYGGVQMADDSGEVIDAQPSEYRVKTPAEVQAEIDPDFAAAVAEAQAATSATTPPPSAIGAHKLGRDEPDSLLGADAGASTNGNGQKAPPPPTDGPVWTAPSLTATGARERITYWANLAHALMATAPVETAALISAAGSAAKAVLANRQATIGDLNRAAEALMAFCRPKEADTPPGAPTTESLPF